MIMILHHLWQYRLAMAGEWADFVDDFVHSD